MAVSISDKARALQALMAELDSVEIEQLELTDRISALIIKQRQLSTKSMGLHTMINKILTEKGLTNGK